MINQLQPTAAVAGIYPATACAEIDLAAFRANVAALKAHAGVPAMVVVKADGYGHGIAECARTPDPGPPDHESKSQTHTRVRRHTIRRMAKAGARGVN